MAGLVLAIYVIAIQLTLAILPLLYVTFTVLIGNAIFKKSHIFQKILFILTLIFSPIAWLANGYHSFEVACETGITENISNSPINNVEGFFLRQSVDSAQPYISQITDDFLFKGVYSYVELGHKEVGYAHRTKDITNYGQPYLKNSKIINPQSKYDFEIKIPEAISPFLKPYFQISKIRILRSLDEVVIAQATEYIYGGGLLGQYIKFFNGKSNNTYLGCGYVDAGIHPFRPTNGSLPALQELYIAKDREFIQKTLVPVSYSGH